MSMRFEHPTSGATTRRLHHLTKWLQKPAKLGLVIRNQMLSILGSVRYVPTELNKEKNPIKAKHRSIVAILGGSTLL